MIIPHNNTYQYQPSGINKNNTPNFSARNKMLRDIDDICRGVIQEFPVVSNTKLKGYSSIKTNSKLAKFYDYAKEVVCKYREYYDRNTFNIRKKLLKEISGMKELKVGNCAELSDATFIALKLNGVKNAKVMHLFAYNKKYESMRDLDHSIVGVNFRLPKGYKHHNWICGENYFEPECRVYPQNDSIIVDAWAGITEYGKNITRVYKSNKALIESNKKEGLPNQDTLLKEGEELCFVPLPDYYKLKKKDLKYYALKYPKIIKDKNKKKLSDNLLQQLLTNICPSLRKHRKDITSKKRFKFSKISPEIKDEIKLKYSLKSTLSEGEINKRKQKYAELFQKRYGVELEQI